MKYATVVVTVILVGLTSVQAQHISSSLREIGKYGVTTDYLDSAYRSAVNVDTSLAVFKTEKQQETMSEAWSLLIEDLGQFLSENDFEWPKPIKCFNRVYFATDGTIDYFLYDLSSTELETEGVLSDADQAEFDRLLNLFIQEYQITVTAPIKFVQCGAAIYDPED